MLAKHLGGLGVDADHSLSTTLGGVLNPVAADHARRAGDGDLRLVQVGRAAAQEQQLAAAGACLESDTVEGKLSVPAGDLEELAQIRTA
jgi:hypothetical protein